MKKRTIGIQAAVAVLLGVAAMSSYAGVATGLTRTIATQAIVSNTTAVATGSVAYSTAVPLPMGTLYIRVQLAGGAKFVGAAGTFINLTSLVVTNNGGSTHTLGAGGGVISADQTYVTFTDVITVAPSPVATVYTFQATATTPTTGGIANVAFLATPAAVLNATLSAGSSPTVFADIDTAAGGNIVTTVNGLTYTALASSAAGFIAAPFSAALETEKINVATGSGIAFDVVSPNTGTNSLVNFGGFTFTDVAGALAADTTTAFNVATNYNTGTSTAVATGNFGAALAAGGSVFLASNKTCVTNVSTGVVTGAGTIATFSAIPYYTSATPVFVCMQLNTANATLVPETTPTIVVTRTGTTVATANVVTPSATLYALKNNGGSQLVRSYIPAAAAGYTSFLRVINTGSVSAAVSVAVVDDTTGVAGTAAVVATVAAGGAVTLNSTQIEAVIGVIAAAKRPTLRVTAPSSVNTQSFILTNANGNFSNVSSYE